MGKGGVTSGQSHPDNEHVREGSNGLLSLRLVNLSEGVRACVSEGGERWQERAEAARRA